MDLQAAFDHGFEAVKSYVDAEIGTLATRIAELEARPTEKGDPGGVGPQGELGPPGPKGDIGEPGRDGRDAADLPLLRNHITEQVAEFVALHMGAISITSSDGGRTLRWAVGEAVHEIKTAIVLDAGIWREGKSYAVGDGVTLGGSFFIAQADTTAKPGASDDWRLAVKRGNDGRDYRPEEERAAKPVRFK